MKIAQRYIFKNVFLGEQIYIYCKHRSVKITKILFQVLLLQSPEASVYYTYKVFLEDLRKYFTSSLYIGTCCITLLENKEFGIIVL